MDGLLLAYLGATEPKGEPSGGRVVSVCCFSGAGKEEDRRSLPETLSPSPSRYHPSGGLLVLP